MNNTTHKAKYTEDTCLTKPALQKQFEEAANEKFASVSSKDGVYIGHFDEAKKEVTVYIIDKTQGAKNISGTGLAAGLADLYENHNLVKVKVGDQEERDLIDIASKLQAGGMNIMQTFKTIFGSDILNAVQGQGNTGKLADFIDKSVVLKLTIEQAGCGNTVTVEYKVNGKEAAASLLKDKLDPKDISVWVDDKISWKDGVKLKDGVEDTDGKLQELLDKAAVTDLGENGTEKDPKDARTSAAKGKFTGNLLVTFEDGSKLVVENQNLYVYANGDEKPEDGKPLPTDSATVTFTKDDNSIKADGWDTVKPIIVKKGTKVPAEKFPSLEGKAAEGYENPGWYKDAETTATADPSTVEITADTTFTAKATNIAPPVNKSEKPTINQPTVGDDKITGKGVAGATIVVKDGNNNEIGSATVDQNGDWEVTVPGAKPLVKGETITATQTETGKIPSEPATTTVKDKTTPTPEGPSVIYSDTPIDKGDTKTVIPEIKDENGNPTAPDKTPEVGQPGNGVVVTPHPDGSITVTIPENYDGPSTIVIPVVVTVDGKVIKTTLTIHVNDGGSGYEPGGDDWYYFPRRPRREIVPTISVFAEAEKKGTPVHDTLWYVFYINEYEYEVVRNGVVTKRLMDVTPVLQNDRTMLPLRYVAEALGAEVEWDNSTRTARFTKDGLTASIQIDGDEIVLSNGKIIKMDSKPLNINDRILVSVTNVANVFGMTNGHTLDGTDQDIEWNQNDKSATIYVRR